MNLIQHFLDIFLHIDKHLDSIMQTCGSWTYLILFGVVFCETGLIVTPFLPGDSLLFAAGALSHLGGLDVHVMVLVIFVAAVLGDSVNYRVGSYLGPKALTSKLPLIRPEYIQRTQDFYARWGAKTIVIARFVPIVRTFAPFLAGVGKMPAATFALYNVFGAALWSVLLVYAGYFFSGVKIVKENFSLVIMAIILLSLLPAIIEILRARRTANAGTAK